LSFQNRYLEVSRTFLKKIYLKISAGDVGRSSNKFEYVKRPTL